MRHFFLNVLSAFHHTGILLQAVCYICAQLIVYLFYIKSIYYYIWLLLFIESNEHPALAD